MSWWRWTCSERGACSSILPRPSSLWAEETFFPFCFHLFLRTFQQPNPFCCNRSTTNLFMISFLSRTIDYLFLSELMDLFVAGRDQSAADQPNYLAEEVTPHCNHCNHYEPTWYFWCCLFCSLVPSPVPLIFLAFFWFGYWLFSKLTLRCPPEAYIAM